MGKDKKYLLKAIKELKPKIEKQSGLKFNLDEIYVGTTRNIFWPLIFSSWSIKKAIIYYYHLGGGYHPFFKVLSLPRKILRKKHFKWILAHELIHACQYNSFPNFHRKELAHNLKFPKSEFNPYTRLLEGDAELILNNFNFPEKKVVLPGWAMKFIGKDYYKRFLKNIRSNYDGSSKIIKRRFGKNRKEINKLYNLSEKKLIKLFNDKS